MDANNIFFSLQTPTPPPKKPVLGEVLNVVRYLMRPLRSDGKRRVGGLGTGVYSQKGVVIGSQRRVSGS